MSSDIDKDYWAETVIIGTRSIYVFERPERANGLFVKFIAPEKRGRNRRVVLKLPGDLRVRDSKGRIDKQSVREVVRAVERFAAPLLVDELPAAQEMSRRPLHLGEAFDRALDQTSGKYATRSLRWQEVQRARRKLERLLGARTLLTDIPSSDVRSVWRRLAKEYQHGSTCGLRQSEVTVDALYSVAAWLREEELLAPDSILPMKNWRSKLKQEWAHIVGESIEPSRPRHSVEEMRSLLRHMHCDGVDPRFGLAFDLGGEQRLGQVIRSRRSDVDLPPLLHGAESAGGSQDFGTVRINGAGKKRTAPIALGSSQRDALERALAGYLADYEALYLAGKIEDYPLFPAGRTSKGKAKVVTDPKHLTRDAALGMFHELEAIAGVAPVKGRGWNGVRRIAADTAEDHENDERVLNSLTGHRDSSTRRAVYQENARPKVLQQAARIREEIRQTNVKVANQAAS